MEPILSSYGNDWRQLSFVNAAVPWRSYGYFPDLKLREKGGDMRHGRVSATLMAVNKDIFSLIFPNQLV